MSAATVAQQRAGFTCATPICGNCRHEKRTRDEARNRTDRRCTRHGWIVLMSGTCNHHAYRPTQATHQ